MTNLLRSLPIVSTRTIYVLALLSALLLSLPAAAEDKPGDDALAKALTTQIDLDVQGVTFDEALKQLNAQLDGVYAVIDPTILEMAKIDREAEIAVTLTNATFKSAFELVFLASQPRNYTSGGWKPPITPTWHMEADDVQVRDGQRVTLMRYRFEDLDKRVYDIRDLLAEGQQDWTKPKWSQEKKQAFRAELLEQLLELIRITVGNASHWTEEYKDQGLAGTINELNGNLIIDTTPDNHRQLKGLFERLRSVRGLQISLEAHLLLVDTDVFAQILANELNNPALAPGKGLELPEAIEPRPQEHIVGPRPQAGQTAAGFIDDQGVEQLLKRVNDAGGINLAVTLPRMTSFNAHRNYILTAGQTSFISDFFARKGLDNQPEPKIAVANTGILFIGESTISADRRYVTSTLRLHLATTNGPTLTIKRSDTEAIQFPQIDQAQLRNTVSIPDQGTLVIGGPTIQGTLDSALFQAEGEEQHTDPAEHDDTRRVLLLVKPTIILNTQEQELLFPGLLDNLE